MKTEMMQQPLELASSVPHSFSHRLHAYLDSRRLKQRCRRAVLPATVSDVLGYGESRWNATTV
jgi:hypothetical protein